MKHLGTTKKTLAFLVAIAFAFSLFSGCANFEVSPPTDSSDSVSNDSSCNGKIKVSLDLGGSSSRSAMPSTFPTGDATKFVFAGAIHDQGTTLTAAMLNIAESSAVSGSDGKQMTVSFPFLVSSSKRENYILEIYAFPNGTTTITDLNTALLFGNTKITIEADEISVVVSETIKMLPNTSSTVNGSVNLKISVPADCTLSAKCTTTGHASESFVCTKSGGTYSVTASNLPNGDHTVIFLIEKGGRIASGWTETIKVYPALATDRWTSGNVDASGVRVISSVELDTTYYVRGTPESGNVSWFADITSATGDDTSGDGSILKPYATIQKAINTIKATTTAETDSFTIYVDGKVTASGSTPVADFTGITSGCSITLKGLDATNKATLDGNKKAQGIKAGSFDGATANLNLTLENLVITKCAAERGSGIFLVTETTNTHTISNCEISYNTATTYGGGIYNKNGNLILESGTISNNTATTDGGGICNANSGTFTMDGGTISSNTASSYGGGICNANSGIVTMNDGTISGNTATSNGGGIYNAGGTFTMNGGTIGDTSKTDVASSSACSNKATNGGGIYNNGGTVTLVGGSISYNYAEDGGGIYSNNVTGSELVMGSGCTTTIKYNCCATSGGGIYSGNTFTMQAGEIANNEARNGGGIFIAYGSTTTVSGGTISNNTATRDSSTDSGGQGISVWNGTLELKGGAKIDSSNNISLYSGESGTAQHLKITGTLTETGTVATIRPTAYTSGTVVLEADDADLIAANYRKFSITPNGSDTWIIKLDATGSKGVLSKVSTVSVDEAITGLATASGEIDLDVVINAQEDLQNLIADGIDKTSADVNVNLKLTLASGSTLTSIGLDDGDEGSFLGCEKLKSIEIPEGIKHISKYEFSETGITSVKLPNSLVSIGEGAFDKCEDLTSIVIPSNVTTIGDFAFDTCSLLESVTVMALTPPALGTSAFDDNSSTRKIYVPAESVDAYKGAANWSTYADSIEAIIAP